MTACDCAVAATAEGEVAEEAIPESKLGTDEHGLPGIAYLSGAWLRSSDRLQPVVDPEDGSLIAEVHNAGSDDIAAAVSGVYESLSSEWELWQRREALDRATVLVREEAARLAGIIARESSKTITEADREVARAAETLRLSAANVHLLEGETLPLADTARGAGRIGWNRRAPLGVVAAITPFNDPLNLVAHKLGPSLIAGNGVVLKPSRETPLSALALVDILLRAGVPAGRIAVSVTDREAGESLVTDPRIAVVSFTGGPSTADIIAAQAGARKLLMELGGNNAVIVCEDGELELAADGIVDGAFGVAGQNCLSVQRVYVHRSQFKAVVELVRERTERLVVGSKRNPATDLGPLIREDEARRVEEWVSEAKAAGATVVTGGVRTGSFFAPTVLTDVPLGSRVLREEVFGPVVSILPFSELSDVVSSVNDTEYGLQAGVFTTSMQTAFAVAEQLHVGSVLINDTSDYRIDSMPFGGSKRSGVGREGVPSAILELSEPKNVIVSGLAG